MYTSVVDNSQYDASVIIVSFNTCDVLRQCLESVIRESAKLRVEILVVDNHSSDCSVEMVEREFPQVCLLRSEVNLGFGAANNLGLQRARGAYFILLNSILGDFVVLTGLAAKFPHSRFFGDFDRTWAAADEAASVDWVPGAFCIIRPSALDRSGLFDPVFFLYYEEVDLCRRIKRSGYTIWYWPDIVVVHIGGESSRQLKTLEFSSQSAQVVMWRMRSTLIYYRKHHGLQAYLAKWMETMLYTVTVLRNIFSRNPLRQERWRRYRKLISLMNQAWKDTRGGRISPPRPW